MTFKFTAPPLNLGMFDLGGVLYHANYFQVYEQTREACLLSKGIKYSDLANKQTHFALTESSQKFIKPVFYGEEVTVSLTCSKLGKSSFELSYELFTDKLVNKAVTKHACVSSRGGELKLSKLPEDVYDCLKSLKDS